MSVRKFLMLTVPTLITRPAEAAVHSIHVNIVDARKLLIHFIELDSVPIRPTAPGLWGGFIETVK